MHILELEHEGFYRRVSEIIDSESNCWNYFAELVKTIEKHSRLEENVLVPLLTFIGNRSLSRSPEEIDNLNSLYDRFIENYDRLVSEHVSMRKILKDIRGQTYRIDITKLVDEILHHMKMEEEMAYPAALAAGELLNSNHLRYTGKIRAWAGDSLPA